MQIEFIELAKLIEVRANSAPWVVTLLVGEKRGTEAHPAAGLKVRQTGFR